MFSSLSDIELSFSRKKEKRKHLTLFDVLNLILDNRLQYPDMIISLNFLQRF